MLVGQDIGLVEVVWISLFGMVVATIAIILLMIFVIIMSKIISQGKKAAITKKLASEQATPLQAPPALAATLVALAAVPDLQPLVPPSAYVSEDEIAGITAALCVETGMRPEQFRIVSIAAR